MRSSRIFLVVSPYGGLTPRSTRGSDPSFQRLAQLEENDKPVLIYSTYPSPAEAERIGAMLVDRGLAACVNILVGMTSIYIWDGKRQRDAEAVMLIKTRASLADTAIAEARKLHPYSNPAFVVLSIDAGSAEFLRWIAEQTAKPT